ncbi:PLP-dependent aminotransferase family protein [Alicyclobacillus tolerans]|uniref:aminotransferase-like domain-containing protein n=1 Tax=Alicyclobacillus tolerans TaxID=90970 RepID=UPI001F2BB301|nr:PLP-dependent aminotransferase family protein [Alicyclobacillus tolerans]MCF8565647.1 PLP-dependent aminotransferase family protein [Alicyclobacillus tolerans]
MDYTRFLPAAVQAALRFDPPGAWIPELPPGCIRLSAGYPAAELVPAQQMVQATANLVNSEYDLPFHYAGSPAAMALPNLILQRLMERQIQAAADNLLITAGSCQALDLVAHALIDGTTTVAVEGPTYMEALEIFHNYTDRVVSYPVDGEGLQVDAFEEDLIRRRAGNQPIPGLLYTIPSFQNPTGTTVSLDRRRRLLDLAQEYDFLILEDDAYGELSFAKPPIPLKAMDDSGRVIHLGSLSKVVAPGLRIGWIVASPKLVEAFSWFKKDLGHPVTEGAVAKYLESEPLSARVLTLREAYRKRRDHMLQALRRYMPDRVSWRTPDGGFFIWLEVENADTKALLPRSLATGVAYVPGTYFYHEPGQGANALRLSFSHVDFQSMEKGVELLAGLL